MPYDVGLASRVRSVLSGRQGVSERKMMGGLQFLVGGRMCCGIRGKSLWVRVGKEERPRALAKPHVSPMLIGKRVAEAFVKISPRGIVTESDLEAWVDLGVAFASGLTGSSKGQGG